MPARQGWISPVTLVGLVLVTATAPAATSAQVFPPAPTAEQAVEIRASLAAMKGNERGPFLRIRWWCADGTVHAPQGTPCRERGGGIQHAEVSPATVRLAELGISVGTILAGTSYEDFADDARAGYRLRQLILERYLFDVDDGWVLRRGRYYRGALQIEDEEKAGRALLEQRLSDTEWLKANYFLATRLVAALPHTRVGADRLMDGIRSAATEIAALDPDFMRLRVRIHSVPSKDDAAAVDAYLRNGPHSAEVAQKLTRLRDDLRAQYDPQRALASLAAYEPRVDAALRVELAALRAELATGDADRSFAAIVRLTPRIRSLIESGEGGGRRAVDLLDLGLSLQERAFVLAEELERSETSTRAAALDRLVQYVSLAYGVGYLSARERDALEVEAARLIADGQTTALAYKNALTYLGRGLDWARGTVRGTFGPAIDSYAVVEPAAYGLSDALLRGSVLLPMSRVLDRLHVDADAELGAAHSILGATVSQGVRGLNPGVAMRTMELLEPGHEHDVDARTIYILQETPPELKPVAGVLTLAEGNLLSHVQLLARNLGIPNASMAPEMLSRLAPGEGREVFYAVTPLGRVVLAWPEDLTPSERALVEAGQPAQVERYALDTSRLRLDVRRPIPLDELRSTDSGILVGPKAANLGQLNADFPGRVSAAVALPFGMFVQHADRRWQGSERTVLAELRAAYARSAQMRADGASSSEVDAFMLERLAWVRQAIEGLEWDPELRLQVATAATRVVDGDFSKGVFIRSDTNVEDLPQFSGAGLNLTVPNQTTLDDVLASVKRVWTSPFSERAYLWRSQILAEQGDVFPSVLIQETVQSEKSGVLITSGLQEGGPDDLTVVVAEGVGGAVDGEDAETLLIARDGTVRLLSQAKSPRRREVVPRGTRWAASRRPEYLLQPGELEQLRDVVQIWERKMVGTPDEATTWDMEFAFVGGRLWLLQVRPFVRFRNSDVYGRLEALDAGARANADRTIRIGDAPRGS